MKANLDNYNSLTDPREHIQNAKSIIELITQKSDVTYKVFLMTFYRYDRVWYYRIEPDFIPGLHDLYVKLIFYFNISILAKKSIVNLFIIT